MRGDESGFTLVEVLVALAIFSVAALGLARVTSDSLRSADAIEARFAARIVAEARLTETLTSPEPLRNGISTGVDVQLSREFAWSEEILPVGSGSADLVSVEVRVTSVATGQQLAQVSALRAR